MPNCVSELLTTSYCHIQQVSQHPTEIIVKRLFCTSGRRNSIVLEAQVVFLSEIFKPICHHSCKAESCCCCLLLPLLIRLKGWVIPNTEFQRNCAAVLPLLYSVPASLYRQSFNTAVVKETMSRYLAHCGGTAPLIGPPGDLRTS